MSDDQPAPSDTRGSRQTSNKGCFLGCGGLLSVFVLFVVATSCGVSGGSSWEPTATEARKVCEGWVKDRLKAPSTAQFANDGTVRPSGTDSWAMTGAVDGENSFGAMIRTAWTCDVRYDSATERWRGTVSLLQ
jgi:hypothetical protein